MKKTYVITGTTSGIGKTLLEAFAKDNIVFAGYRNEKYLEDLKSVSDNVIPFYINMERKESIALKINVIFVSMGKENSICQTNAQNTGVVVAIIIMAIVKPGGKSSF